MLNFYFFILFLVIEGEVKWSITTVYVWIDESHSFHELNPKVAWLIIPECFTKVVYLLLREVSDDGDGDVATCGHIDSHQ